MNQPKETLTVHVNIEMTPKSLKTIVSLAKQQNPPNEKGHYTVDTADAVSDMVSRFLEEKNFEAWVCGQMEISGNE